MTGWRLNPAQIAAKYKFIPGETDADKSFLAKFPPATVPVFEGQDGTCLFDVNAIQLRGGSKEHLVTQWVNFTDNGIMPSVATWVYPCLGVTQYNKQNTEKAKTHIRTVLSFMDNYLRNATYLVGERLSQADITVFTAIYLLFTYVCDDNCRKQYPHVVRWYTTVANQPHVMEVVGKVNMCVDGFAFLKASVGRQAKETTCGATRRRGRETEIAIPYFWDHFDPNTHSIWYCEYLYPEDLRMIFMSCNLISGMFQRLEKMLKFAFGSMCIFGEDGKSTISGLWIWRGTGLAFELSPDLQTDYESYSWRKLDPNDAETKRLVHEYFLQEFSDKPFNQGKIFK
ncbi:unnamed protein product [Echinostoma caproni]|uniref:Elongation factor 1-gamma n=1 Tax=Echinostoma caproni TaxID=27848 RepID=A0A183AF54_9TREM|nr:unnamed protein product [Echinostoma caproni]